MGFFHFQIYSKLKEVRYIKTITGECVSCKKNSLMHLYQRVQRYTLSYLIIIWSTKEIFSLCENCGAHTEIRKSVAKEYCGDVIEKFTSRNLKYLFGLGVSLFVTFLCLSVGEWLGEFTEWSSLISLVAIILPLGYASKFAHSGRYGDHPSIPLVIEFNYLLYFFNDMVDHHNLESKIRSLQAKRYSVCYNTVGKISKTYAIYVNANEGEKEARLRATENVLSQEKIECEQYESIEDLIEARPELKFSLKGYPKVKKRFYTIDINKCGDLMLIHGDKKWFEIPLGSEHPIMVCGIHHPESNGMGGYVSFHGFKDGV